MWTCKHCGMRNWEDAEQCHECSFSRTSDPPKPTKQSTITVEHQQDVFISYARHDYEDYIQSLADALAERSIIFWLDNIEVGWGDSIIMAVNEGLAKSRFVLFCLSQNFLKRRWPEAELSAAFAIQNNTGEKRVLPLILNSKDHILARYPLLAGLSNREFSVGPSVIADEIASLVNRPVDTEGQIRIVVESVHTGQICNIKADPRVSVRWLTDKARSALGVSDLADTGAYEPFRVRWVLVDSRVEGYWRSLDRSSQRKLRAIVAGDSGPIETCSEIQRLQEIKIKDGTVFHLYAIEDEDYGPPPADAG